MDNINNTALTITDEQKKTAAYALNMCMVSVSQIIDYDDLYILEQEYDGILNNLNLEKMPKDEVLLNILKQLLDTISYFRITEKERNIFEKEYQQRMRNAIWSAVPTVGLISTGGSPLSIEFGISLASQVGIGYMNYRREKAKILLDKEKNEWKLQRTAMEQFHGLRRELFDTAWRLAERYQFPDEYRITEKQIKEYNEALLDQDALRRYERLDYMRGKFEAYPPFWYQLGSAANAIAQDYGFSEEVRIRYQGYAEENFNRYLNDTEHNLLRDDQLLASCALEYFNIVLQGRKDKGNLTKQEKSNLLKMLARAQEAAGNSYDVLQMCALAYLQLGEWQAGAKILRMLVNQSYNKIVNGQLLSSIYISDYIRTKDEGILVDYNTLAVRVGGENLFPLPTAEENYEMLEDVFIQTQKNLLARKAAQALKRLAEKYTILYNRAIPAADLDENHTDEYYSDGLREIRMEDIIGLMERKDSQRTSFLRCANLYVNNIFDVLNRLYDALGKIHGIDEKIVFERLSTEIQQHSVELEALLEATGNGELTEEEIETMFALDFKTMTAGAFAYVLTELYKRINELNDMNEIVAVDAEIQGLCMQEELPVQEAASYGQARSSAFQKIDLAMLGRVGLLENRKNEKRNEMLRCLKSYEDKLFIDDGKDRKVEFLLREENDSQFNSYAAKNKKVVEKLAGDLLAVIDDTAWGSGDGDILFTTIGIVHYREDAVIANATATVPYEQISQVKEAAIQLDKLTYKDSQVNMKELFSLIQELAEIKGKRNRGKVHAAEAMSELSDKMPDNLLQLQLSIQEELPLSLVGNDSEFAAGIEAVTFKSPGQCGVTAKILGYPVHEGDCFTVFKNGAVISGSKATIKTLRIDGRDLPIAQPGENVTLFLAVEGIEYSALERALLTKTEESTDGMKKAGENQILLTEEAVLAFLERSRTYKGMQASVALTAEEDIEDFLDREESLGLDREKINRMVADANKVVLATVATTSATSAIPIPFADAPLLIAQQTALMMQISKIFEIDLKEDGLKTLVTTILGVGGATIAGKTIATNLLKLVPFAGSLIGGAISAGTAGGITLALGNAFIEVCKNIKEGKLSAEDLLTQKGQNILQEALKEQLKRN